MCVYVPCMQVCIHVYIYVYVPDSPDDSPFICMSVCMYTRVCICTCVYIRINVNTYVCKSVNVYACIYAWAPIEAIGPCSSCISPLICMYVCINVCVYVIVFVSMYVSMLISRYGCMYVCIWAYGDKYICMYVCIWASYMNPRLSRTIVLCGMHYMSNTRGSLCVYTRNTWGLVCTGGVEIFVYCGFFSAITSPKGWQKRKTDKAKSPKIPKKTRNLSRDRIEDVILKAQYTMNISKKSWYYCILSQSFV